MTKEQREDAIAQELFVADVWLTEAIDGRRLTAFIVERDAKRDETWARYADARAELAISREMSSWPVIEAATAELRDAAEALRALGIDVDVPPQVVQR